MAKRSVLNAKECQTPGTFRDFGDGAVKRLYLKVRAGADGQLTRSWHVADHGETVLERFGVRARRVACGGARQLRPAGAGA